jgi:hypothetical protein
MKDSLSTVYQQLLEKVKRLDRVNQQFLWKSLEKYGYPVRLIRRTCTYRQPSERIFDEPDKYHKIRQARMSS